MTSVIDDVKRLIGEACAADPAAIREDGKLIGYGLDSVRAMDLIISLEEHFGIKISDDAAAKLKTVGDVVRFVEQATAGKPGAV